ncbi:ATP-binding protein [Spirillospora sp. NPDC029432]|uniref:ATP-binding protein n=1 Tax=Spirillospora sp. NPDC029432 TaxID=3154599 RepID=UPI003456C8D1
MSAEHHFIDRPGEAAVLTAVPTGEQLGELTLPAAHESVPRARAFVRTLTGARGVPHVRDDAEILVSELVTNAVRHAPAGDPLRLVVLRRGTCLRIEVHDPSPVTPSLRRVDLLDETGRGWFLVAAIADRHGIDRTDSGKSVWCELMAWPSPGILHS